MRAKVNEKVSMVSYYSSKRSIFVPYLMHWQNKEYVLEMDGLIHKYKDGDIWYHVYEVINKEHDLAFRLLFNSKDLNWTLEVVSDGLPA